MFSTNFNGQDVFVIDDAWDGNSTLQGKFRLERDTQEGLTKRGTRRPYSATLLAELKYDVTVHDAALRVLQGSLRALTTEPVILPLWPAVTRWADRAAAAISGGLRIVWKDDWSQFEIYAATDPEPGWPAADDNLAAALQGFIIPSFPKAQGPDAAVWTVQFTESSPAEYALAPIAVAMTAGPLPAGYATAPKLLPFKPDFLKVMEQISVEVGREQAGFVREQRAEFYPHSAFRSQQAGYTLTGDDVGKLLRFFRDTAAPGVSFWASGWLQVARLTQDAIAADTVLHVEDTSAINNLDYVSLFNGETIIARKVIDKTANTFTVDAAVGAALSTDTECIFALCLAAIDLPTLVVKWQAPELAMCELQWTEVLPEVFLPNDETIELTIGKLPLRAVLFHFWRDYGNGTVIDYYFTSHEEDVTWNGHLWISGPFQCHEVTLSLNLEADYCDISGLLTKPDGTLYVENPLVLEVMIGSEVPLNLRVYFVDLVDNDPSLQGVGGEPISGVGSDFLEPVAP